MIGKMNPTAETAHINNPDRMSRILYRLNSYGMISMHMLKNGIPLFDILRSQFPLISPNPARPVLITLELTNCCNLRCSYCTNPLELRDRGFMQENVFENAVSGIKRLGIKRVRVVGNGEPTLHPKFKEYIARLSESTPYLQTLSNGQWKEPERIIDALLVAPVKLIEVTVEGMDAARYESSCNGGSFELLLKNLKMLKREKEKRRSNAVTNLRLMIRPSDKPRLHELKRFWNDYCDTVMPQKLMVQRMVDNTGDLFMPVQLEDQTYPVCALPFNAMGVNWCGDIPLCYNSLVQYGPPGLMLGNLSVDRLEEVWNGEILNQYRRAHHRRIENEMPLCRGCTAV